MCPTINILPPIEQCRGRPSNCWSVGVADTDCIGNALCCFDGCANVCQGEGPINGNPGPQTNGRGQQRQQTVNLNINSNKNEVFQLIAQPPIKEQLGASSVSIQNTKQNNRGQPLSSQNQPLIQSIQKKPAIIISTTQNPTNTVVKQPLINTIENQPTVANTGNNKFVPEAGGGYGNSQLDITSQPIKQDQSIPPVYKNQDSFIFPEENEEPRFPTFPKKRNPSYSNISPVTLETEEHQTTPIQVTQPNPIQDIVPNTIQVPQSSLSKDIQQNPVKITQPNPVQEIQQNPSPSQQSGDLASSQPFVTCPSAMKCVPKISCNFNGVLVEEQVVLSEAQERQRVPLIPCFSPVRSNAVDVCCRDPNYKDPWPENGNGNNGQFTNENSGQFSNGSNGQLSNGNKGQFINVDNGQFSTGNNGQFNNENSGQLIPTQQGKVQGSELFQEQIKTDVKINIPKKRKTHGYGK